MNNMKTLPIGTIVTLKKEKKKVIIIGYMVEPEEEPGKIYDYIGYFYPGGFMTRKENLIFNSTDIDQVFYYGFKNKEYDDLVKYLGGKENV